MKVETIAECSLEHSAILLTYIKAIEILAIILVPLIMTLSRGHTGQIKGPS